MSRVKPQPQRDTRVIGTYRRTNRCDHGFAIGSGLCAMCERPVSPKPLRILDETPAPITWREGGQRSNLRVAQLANERAKAEARAERAWGSPFADTRPRGKAPVATPSRSAERAIERFEPVTPAGPATDADSCRSDQRPDPSQRTRSGEGGVVPRSLPRPDSAERSGGATGLHCGVRIPRDQAAFPGGVSSKNSEEGP